MYISGKNVKYSPLFGTKFLVERRDEGYGGDPPQERRDLNHCLFFFLSLGRVKCRRRIVALEGNGRLLGGREVTQAPDVGLSYLSIWDLTVSIPFNAQASRQAATPSCVLESLLSSRKVLLLRLHHDDHLEAPQLTTSS